LRIWPREEVVPLGLGLPSFRERSSVFLMRALIVLMAVLGLGLFPGCGSDSLRPAGRGEMRGDAGKAGEAPTPSSSGATAPKAMASRSDEPVYHLPHAQSRLPSVRVFAGAHEIEAEVCITLEQVATGLMFREGIAEDKGMLFVFRTPRQRAFYMKNVGFPIDAAYIDEEGVIQEVVQLKPMEETPVVSKSDRIQFVLETAPDWFTRRGLGAGTLVMTERGPLKQALAGSARLP
jgi:uncharacterized membrane protein (UPF0127 family)